MSTLLIMLGYYLIIGLLTWLSVWAVARWLRFGRPGAGRAAIVAALWMLLSMLSFVVNMLLADRPGLGGAMMFSPLIGLSLVAALIILKVQRTTVGKAFASWGIASGVQILLVVCYLFIGRRYLLEAYRLPTTGMAPTILCRYATMTCPKCGGTMYFSMDADILAQLPFGHGGQVDGACTSCGERVWQPQSALQAHAADRFLVGKYLAPQRWSIIAYHHHAGGQDDTYLKRIIGMPGDDICIHADGSVQINGKPASPPAGAPAKFPWLVLPRGVPADSISMALHPEESLKLGADDYFIIGDDSVISNDSRVSGPIHRADIIGVATMIYWPLNRIRPLK